MIENNQDDFNFFANSKRVKKEEPVAVKSPLDNSSKWNIQEEPKRSISEIVEKKLEATAVKQEQSPPKANYSNEESIGNVGAELQKYRKYPTKTYDKFLNKMVLFNEEEFYLIRDLSAEISMARKRSTIANKGSLPRITENTIIRAALKAVFSKIGNNGTDLSTLQTEEALESYFNSLLK